MYSVGVGVDSLGSLMKTAAIDVQYGWVEAGSSVHVTTDKIRVGSVKTALFMALLYFSFQQLQPQFTVLLQIFSNALDDQESEHVPFYALK